MGERPPVAGSSSSFGGLTLAFTHARSRLTIAPCVTTCPSWRTTQTAIRRRPTLTTCMLASLLHLRSETRLAEDDIGAPRGEGCTEARPGPYQRSKDCQSCPAVLHQARCQQPAVRGATHSLVSHPPYTQIPMVSIADCLTDQVHVPTSSAGRTSMTRTSRARTRTSRAEVPDLLRQPAAAARAGARPRRSSKRLTRPSGS